MTDSATNDASQNDRLDEILAGYLDAEQSGQRLDRERLLAENTDLADELRAFFADHDRMKAVAEPLRVAEAPKGESAAEEATMITHNAPASTDEESGLPPTKVDTVAGQRGTDSSPEPGSVVRYFGDYELLSEVARGGMGVVYKARQVKLNRVVALKMILSGQFASPIDVQRFHSEAEAAAQLDHVGIVPIYEVGEYEGHHFFTMGFIDGGSLSARLRDGPLPPRDAAELVQRIAEAVQYAHERGVIHRDLKPANVLLDRHGQPRITDFGLAKNVGHDSGLTASGQIMGTPGYMPPEQAAGHIQLVGETADIYSLGAVLYALLTGRPPFQADNMLDTLKQVIDKEPVSPAALNARVPLDLETICLKCLEKDRQRRYVSSAALADDLGRYLRGEPIAARPVSRVERAWRWAKRKPVLAGLMATVAALLVTVVVVPSVLAVRLNVARQESDRNAGEATKNQKLAEANAITAESQRREAVKQAGIAKAQEKLASEAKVRAEKGEQAARRRFYAAQMNLAGQAAAQGHMGRVLELLESQRPRFDEEDLRSFEWYHLWQVCFRGQTRVSSLFESSARLGHDAVYATAVSPDGRLLVAGTRFGRVRCFTLPGMEDAGEIKAADIVWGVTFSPNGQTLVVADDTGVLRLWDVATHRELRTLVGPHRVATRTVSFSPDGNLLAVAYFGGPGVQVWDLTVGKILPLQLLDGFVGRVAFSPDGKLLAASDRAGNFGIWTWDGTQAEKRVWQNTGSSDDAPLAFSADSSRLVTGGPAARVWDSATGREVARLPDESASVDAVAISNDGKTIAFGTQDRQVKLWNLETNAVDCRASRGPVHTVTFSPDDTSLFTGGEDSVVRQWLVAAEPEPRVIARARVSSLAFAPTSDLLAATCRDGHVQLWDAATGREVTKLEAHTGVDSTAVQFFGGANAVAFSPDGKWLASGGGDSNVKLWETDTWQLQNTLDQGQGRSVYSVAFSPDGLTLAASCKSQTVLGPPARLWDVASGAEKPAPPGQHWGVPTVAFSSDGQRMATGQQFGTVALWDAATGREVATLESRTAAHHNINSVAFSPDGKLLVSAGNEGTIKLWDVPGEQLRATLKGHSTDVRRVAFFPNGQTVASCARDGTVKFWDVATAQERASFLAHNGAVTGLAVSRDGTLLATAGEDETVKLWHVSSEPAALASRDELDSSDPESPVVQLRVAGRLHAASRFEDAEKTYRAAITRLDRLVALFPNRPQYRTELANARLGLSATLQSTPDRNEQAERELRLARDLLQTLAVESPTSVKILASLALCQTNLASLLNGLGRSDDAEPAFQQARELYERLVVESPSVTEYQQGLVRLATLQSARGRLDEAEQIYQRLLELRPNSPTALNNLAWNLVRNPDAKLRDPARAVPIARRAVELSPQSGLYWNTLGVAHYRAADWPAAIDALERAMSLRSGGDSFDWFVMAMACHQQGETIDARFWYDSAVEWMATNKPKDDELVRFRTEARSLLGRTAEEPPANAEPSSAAWWLSQGTRCTAEGAWDKSVVRFSRAIALDHKSVRAWQERGAAYHKLGRRDQAIVDYSKALELQPGDWKTLFARGEAHQQLGRHDKALSDYDAAITTETSDSALLFARARLLTELQQWDKAVAAWTATVELVPQNGIAWFQRGMARSKLDQWEQAAADFDQAAVRGEHGTTATRWKRGGAHRAAGGLQAGRGELTQAEASYAKSLAIIEEQIVKSPEDPWLYNELAWTLEYRAKLFNTQNKKGEAEADFARTLAQRIRWLDTGRDEINVRIAFCLHVGQWMADSDAELWTEVARHAVTLWPADPAVWTALGIIEFQNGRWREANAALDRSLELRPVGDGATWFCSAMTHWKLEDKDQASLRYERGVKWLEQHAPDASKFAAQHRIRTQASALLGRTVAELDRAITANPNDPAPRLARARLFSGLKQWDQAVADYSEVLKLKLDDPTVWSERANLYTFHLGLNDKAVGDYGEAIRLKPNDAWNWGRRGRTYMLLSQWDKATADIEQAIKLESPVGEDWYWYVLLRLHAGKTDDYRAICARLFDRYRDTKDGWSAISMARAWSLVPGALDDPKHAVRLAEFVVSADAKNGWHQHVLGLAHYRAGQHEQAIHSFRESLAVQWPEPLNWLGLALAHHSLGQPDAAREWFTKADQWYDAANEQYSKSPPGTPAPYAHHWLEIQLLHREAKKLIK